MSTAEAELSPAPEPGTNFSAGKAPTGAEPSALQRIPLSPCPAPLDVLHTISGYCTDTEICNVSTLLRRQGIALLAKKIPTALSWSAPPLMHPGATQGCMQSSILQSLQMQLRVRTGIRHTDTRLRLSPRAPQGGTPQQPEWHSYPKAFLSVIQPGSHQTAPTERGKKREERKKVRKASV